MAENKPAEPNQAAKRYLVQDGLRYDLEESKLTLNGLPVPLNAFETHLLAELAQEPGLAKSRQELADGFDGTLSDRAIDVQITRLRRKLEANPKQPRYLQTVRGAGYMLTSD